MNNFCKFRQNKINKMFKIVFYFLLAIGCIAHSYQICELYYSYPTIVSSETQFENIDNVLPAITICGYIDQSNRKLNINDFYNKINAKQHFKNASLYRDTTFKKDITSDVLKSLIFAINSHYYCLTINSRIKGKNQ